MTAPEPATPGDLSSIADRLALLQAVRLAMALAVLVAGAVLPEASGSVGLVVVTGLYVLATVVAEVGRRVAHTASPSVLSTLLLVDGTWAAFALANAGGPQGPLGFLVYAHVVAVTLLLSYRTGLKVAVWHALLLLVIASIELEDPVGVEPWAVVGEEPSLAFSAVGFLLLAVGTAWCSSLSERALRRGKTELGALVQLGTDLERARSSDEVHHVLLSHVTDRLGFRRAVVLNATPGGVCGVVRAGGTDVLVSGRGLEVDAVAAMGRGYSGAATLDPASFPLLDRLLPGAVNVLLVPLVADGLGAAVLAVEAGGGRRTRVSASTAGAVVQSAAHAALSLRNAALLAEVQALATRDGLTGLLNRRVFDEALDRAVRGAHRSGEPLSLVVFDVDRFKTVNDTFGHPVGDEVLRAVGDCLEAASRGGDLAARYGGEEFVLLLPACDGPAALVITERLRCRMAEVVTAVPVTVSAGLATLPSDATSARSLMAAADAALYEAKRRGRDRTVRVAATVLDLDAATVA